MTHHTILVGLAALFSLTSIACLANGDGATLAFDPNVAVDGTAANPFVDAVAAPSSPIALQVSAANYYSTRAQVMGGQLPNPATVRLEELINAVGYGDPAPDGAQGERFTATLEGAPTAFGTTLMRVGIRCAGADAAAVNVTFDADHVAAYRLIGYDNPTHFGSPTDVGPAPAGLRLTVLYELRLTSRSSPGVLAQVHLVRSQGADVLASIDRADLRARMDDASADLQFALTAAAFGELLKESPYASRYSPSAVRARMAANVAGAADRKAFLELFDSAMGLFPTPEPEPWVGQGS